MLTVVALATVWLGAEYLFMRAQLKELEARVDDFEDADDSVAAATGDLFDEPTGEWAVS